MDPGAGSAHLLVAYAVVLLTLGGYALRLHLRVRALLGEARRQHSQSG
jgi:hypothetical protein